MEPQIELEKVRQDEGKGVNYARRKSKKRKKKQRVLKKVVIVLAVLLILLVGICVYLFVSGQSKLNKKGQESRPQLQSTEDMTVDILDEDTIKYNGKKYKYNKDMINLLFLGTDTSGSMIQDNEEGADAGQADTLILMALDNKAKKVSLIPINRDTMTDIETYDIYGKYAGTQKEQIALSYAYGDGGKKSAELTKKAVSNLFYGLPIQGYFAINTSAITVLNDLIGGVEVTLLDDFTFVDPAYTKGAQVRLRGEFAETYLRGRMDVGDGTNTDRMERQQQYLTALASQMLGAVKKDLTLPVSIYRTITDYMVTDISADEISYLATQAAGYSIDGELIRKIGGESVEGEPFMEFHTDEKSFYELILDVFYNEVS